MENQNGMIFSFKLVALFDNTILLFYLGSRHFFGNRLMKLFSSEEMYEYIRMRYVFMFGIWFHHR